MIMDELTHINQKGEVTMVDVTDKDVTTRIASASAKIFMLKKTLEKIKNNSFKKGDVLATARIAGITSAKKTADLIPLCHQLNLSKISIDFKFIENGVQILTTAKIDAKTGVEMEALTAASVTALTIYDMCKAVDRGMVISDIKLLEKTGGKSEDWKLQ